MQNKILYGLNKLKKSGFAHVFGSSVINKIVAFASSIILARILSKSGYGIYTYAENILSFFTLLSGLGVVSGVLQMCSETNDGIARKKLYAYGCRVGLSFNIILAIVILVISYIIKLPIAHSNELLALMCLLPLANLLSELQRTYLRTELRNKEFAYSNSFSTVLTFFASCCLSLLFKAKGLVFAHYFAAICTFFFIVCIYRVPFTLKKPDISKNEKKQMLTISSISMVNNGLSRLMYLLDIFVLGLFVKDDTVIASYKIATIIPTALVFIPTSIVTFIYPYFARHREDREWVKLNYLKLTLYSGCINVFISVVMFIFARIIIKLAFGIQYLDALIPFKILCVSFAISGTFRIIAGNILVTQRKLKFNLFIAVFSSLFNTIMNVIMIRKWASTGAALATILTVILTSILNVCYLVKTINDIPETSQ